MLNLKINGITFFYFFPLFFLGNELFIENKNLRKKAYVVFFTCKNLCERSATKEIYENSKQNERGFRIYI